MSAEAAIDTTNPYLDFYRAQLEHQREAGELFPGFLGRPPQPDRVCACRACRGTRSDSFDNVRRYSWAVPDEAAIAAIAEHSPNGVVEIGAGGGYWALMLRRAGVDVVAYDPDPTGGLRTDGTQGWHDGTCWSEVLTGDHTSVRDHAGRTLLMVWPSYGGAWSDEVLDVYDGDTVVYVGEGGFGCTGSDRMHQILGLDSDSCWHDAADDCDCTPPEAARFTLTAEVDIPQWSGLHDRLYVCHRLDSPGGAS